MPKLVKIEVNPEFKAQTAQEKAALEAAKKSGQIEVSFATAMENIRQSGGLYRVVPTIQPEAAAKPRRLDEMPNDELKLMMLNLGIKTEKQMKRADIISLIQTRLDAVEVLEDEA